MRFSPDSRWVVSAGQDGLIKLWGLTAGKLLSSFEPHDGAVTAVEYHPTQARLIIIRMRESFSPASSRTTGLSRRFNTTPSQARCPALHLNPKHEEETRQLSPKHESRPRAMAPARS